MPGVYRHYLAFVFEASALTIALSNGSEFRNGRHFASYLGRVPKERNRDRAVKLLDITKRGDPIPKKITHL
ncbi:transposase [Photorhabdus khanii]